MSAFDGDSIISSKWLTEDFDKIFSVFNKNTETDTVENTPQQCLAIIQVPGHNRTTLNIEHVDGGLSIKSIKDALPKGAREVNKKLLFNIAVSDLDNISAECKDGLLTIIVPVKQKEAKPKVTIK